MKIINSCWSLVSLPVDLLAMANLYDTDDQVNIGDRIDDPVGTLTNTIFVIVAGKFFTTGRTRIGGKILNAFDNAKTVFLGG